MIPESQRKRSSYREFGSSAAHTKPTAGATHCRPTVTWQRNGSVQGSARRVLRVALGLVTACTLATTAVYAQTPKFERLTVRIAAWNLNGFHAIRKNQAEEQAKALAILDAEIVALVETNPDALVDTLINELADTGVCYEEKTVNQAVQQDIAVIHKCDVSVENPRLVPDSNDGNNHLAQALAVDVQVGAFDFLLIVVHLQAGRGATQRSTRHRQAQAIARFISSETDGQAEQDVLLVGDYNMIPGQDIGNFHNLSPNGFLDFISSHDLRAPSSHISSSGAGYLLDGYAITTGRTQEYVPGSLAVVRVDRAMGKSLQRFRTDVSDHLPLAATFRIDTDDD